MCVCVGGGVRVWSKTIIKFVHVPKVHLYSYYDYVLQFHGSGSLSKCEGTSQEQALLNQAIRKSITDREEVKSLYEVIMLCIYILAWTRYHRNN